MYGSLISPVSPLQAEVQPPQPQCPHVNSLNHFYSVNHINSVNHVNSVCHVNSVNYVNSVNSTVYSAVLPPPLRAIFNRTLWNAMLVQ